MSKTTSLRQQKDQARKERTRAQLLNAAEQVFIDSGFHATRISDIVKAAQLGQGSFYRHFQSKRAIFEALLDRLSELLVVGFTGPSITLPESIEEHRTITIRGASIAAEVIKTHRDVLLLFLREGPSVGSDFQDRLEGLYGHLADVAERYLQHGLERGFMRPHNPTLVAQAIVGQVLRAATLWLDGRLEEHAIEHIITEMVDYALWGYAGQPL